MPIPADVAADGDDAISDYLSDLTGFCHAGYRLTDDPPSGADRARRKPVPDTYYDVTCGECARSRSTDFEMGMEASKDVLRARASQEGWIRKDKKNICPDCARKASGDRKGNRKGGRNACTR